MCPSEDLRYCTCPPVLRKRIDSLYDNEVESDVVFLVGKEPDVWRFPGHTDILSQSNIVFNSMFIGPLATTEKIVVIDDVDCRAFDYLLKHLYGKEIKFKSVSTALYTLFAGHKYLCFSLVKLCIDYLQDNLTIDNVLEIFKVVRYICPIKSDHCEPSAPPLEMITTISNDLSTFPNSLDSKIVASVTSQTTVFVDGGEMNAATAAMRDLLDKCLKLIDQNADRILLQEAIEDLDKDSLRDIVKRDTLKVTSEYNVFLALDRWTNRECKRKQKVLNSCNRRDVLGDLLYEIRFPFLKPEELLRKPIQTGLLTERELKMVSALISKSKKVPEIPDEWKPYIDKMKQNRTLCENKSLVLSQKTYLTDLDKNQKELRRSYSFFRWRKNKDCPVEKTKKFRSMSIDSCKSDKKCMTRLAEYFLDIFVCLFD